MSLTDEGCVVLDELLLREILQQLIHAAKAQNHDVRHGFIKLFGAAVSEEGLVIIAFGDGARHYAVVHESVLD